MKRRDVLKGLGALTLVDSSRSLAKGEQPGGQGLYRVRGKVQVNGKPAREGSPVKAGDTVTTGPDAEAVYVVGQDAYLQRANSTVNIFGDGVKAGLRILSGKLLSVFGQGDKRLETATATIGIRGTGCYIESEPQRVYFCLCYGVAEVTPSADPRQAETLETRHHDHPLYILADGSRAMVPASVLNHNDAELIELESLVGRQPPFLGSYKRY